MPTKTSSPELSAAMRFEVVAGDVVRRVEMQELTIPGSVTADVLEATRRLKRVVEAHEIAVAQPINDQAMRLIERQGEVIRADEVERVALEGRLAEACARIADFADAQAGWQDRELAARAQGRAEGERDLVERARRVAETSEEKAFVERLAPKGVTLPGRIGPQGTSPASLPF